MNCDIGSYIGKTEPICHAEALASGRAVLVEDVPTHTILPIRWHDARLLSISERHARREPFRGDIPMADGAALS
jgi:hypothetical protein